MENRRGARKALVGKPEGKRRLGKPRCRWKGNTKLIFKNWNGDTDWIWPVAYPGVFFGGGFNKFS